MGGGELRVVTDAPPPTNLVFPAFLFLLARKVKELLSGLFDCRVGIKGSFSRVYYFFYLRVSPTHVY